LKEAARKLFERIDVIVTPTVPIPAPRIADGDPKAIASLARFTRFFNILGLPAISIPCGFSDEGMPIGLQIAGKAFDESTVLRVAHAYSVGAVYDRASFPQ
jgi:aspartyl-tRNA(Asn)/glutamyl-tRNA(Gln) amidotransferase subunit A